jgi:hypothetical protein
VAATGKVADETTGMPEDSTQQVVRSWLTGVLAGAPIKIEPQKVTPIEDPDVQRTFAGDDFFGITFATWPVAPRLPKELSHETLVRVRRGGSAEPIRDHAGLTAVLAATLTDVTSDDRARTAVLAALRLAEAVARAAPDGFQKPDASVVHQGDSIVATARAAAAEPARGQVAVHLEFGPDGRVKSDGVRIEDRTRRGPPGPP